MAIVDEIKDRQAEFVKVFNSSNPTAAASFYAKDCCFLPAGHQPVKGRDAVEAHFKKDMSEGLQSVNMNTEEVNGSGEWAFERGSYRATGILGPETGSYVIVWHKVDGSWYIHNDCFNIIKPHG